MRRTAFLSMAALAALCACGDGLGIDITKTTYDVFGVDVEFETDLPPPYVVAVFTARHAQFMADPSELSRTRPVRYRIVNGRRGSIAGDFWRRKGHHFVQVLAASYTNNPAFRAATTTERDAEYDALRDMLDPERPLAPSSAGDAVWSARGRDDGAWRAYDGALLDDWTWGTFLWTDEPSIVLKGRGKHYDGTYRDAEEQNFGPFDTSVGTGYRVLVDERTGEFTVTRAYSLLPDCSQCVLLARPLKPLSMSDERKISMDWLGQMRYVTETNAVPHKIYWDGL